MEINILELHNYCSKISNIKEITIDEVEKLKLLVTTYNKVKDFIKKNP